MKKITTLSLPLITVLVIELALYFWASLSSGQTARSQFTPFSMALPR